MMKRYFLSIILGILTLGNYASGQLDVNFSAASGPANGTVDVDVTVNGFTNMGGLSFTANWDSLVMTYNSVVSTNSALPDLVASNVSGPSGAALDEGQFTLSYGNPNGNGTLSDGEVIFTVRFDLIGEECATTSFELGGDPTVIEAFDGSFTELTVTSMSGDVMINGSDCGGGGGGSDDDLTIVAATTTVAPGGSVCVPLTSTNFAMVQAGSGTILWDQSVISYTGISNVNIAGVDGSLNTTQAENGELKFVWSNPDPANPVTLADGTPIFDICFDAVGNLGDMSDVTLSTQGSLGFEWFDDADEVIPQSLTNGKVTITQEAGPPFTIIVSEESVVLPDNEICVDVSVQNFDNILSTQYVLTWDASVLTNATPNNFNLNGVNANSFNINDSAGSATFSWNNNVGIDVADNTVIYSICYDVVGGCDESSTVQIISQGSTQIEIVDGNTDVVDNVSIDQGSVTITCEEVCEVTNIDRPCAGSLSGNVTVNVPDGCSYSWANSAGTEISTSKNLLGVGAGTYILTVSCDGTETCTVTAEVEALPSPVISGSVTNAGCGDLGSIDLAISGGSGSYSYNWNPALPDSPNVSGLQPSNYEVTVTDNSSQCTSSDQFTVETTEEPLEIGNVAIVDESCVGNNGRITLSLSGGCMPYSFAWSDASIGNTPDAVNLAAGTYGVTITDDATPTNTVTGSYVVDAGGSMIMLNGDPVITPETDGMGNGTITINVTGGVEPYSYSWSGPTASLPNSNMITGLSEGAYEVTVTDAEGCSVELGPYDVINTVTEGDPMIGSIGAVDAANGFSVICNGGMTGEIAGVITGGVPPFTVTLGGDASETVNQDAAGAFSFQGLSAGSYTVTVSNSLGSVTSEVITVTEPSDMIVFDVEKGCDEQGQCDGFIDIDVEGGFGDITIDWGDPNLTGESLDDLCEGTYTVTFTDENGCSRMADISIDPCSMAPIGCYEVRNVITPNGDGMNETFAVTCINDFPASVEIFDRWGQLVYNQATYNGLWSGIDNDGQELPEGGYMYVIVIDFGQGNREVMKGTITLLRD